MMTEIIARRQFTSLYIWLDIAFLVVFLILLLWQKKYMTVMVGCIMGIVYMLAVRFMLKTDNGDSARDGRKRSTFRDLIREYHLTGRARRLAIRPG